ncbi:MAG TPA: hypothetical protein VGC52_00890 [Gemmatimonadaceae bacterium]
MPAYTVAATAVTLGMPIKWVDNVLSHHEVPGVSQSRQGVSRRLAPQAILTLDLALRISNALGVPISRALELSASLLRQPGGTTTIDLGQGVSLTIDLEEVRSELLERLAHAVEVAPSPRRGRPAGP